MNKPKILLTGSEGKMATRAIKPALENDFELVGFDLVLGDDLLNADSIRKKIEGIDYVIHTATIPRPQASNERDSYIKVNVDGSRLLIESAKKAGVKKFIFFSSFSRCGVDSWMRNRLETGPITGPDVAVPKFLPITEEHPSILNYENLYEWGGKWYGESKALVERIGEEASDENFSFISLRLAGIVERSEKWAKHRGMLFESAKQQRPDQRKQNIYGAAGNVSAKLLSSTLLATLNVALEGFQTFNVVEATVDNEEIVQSYFPEDAVTDQIFGNQKLRVLLNKAGYNYSPTPLPRVYGNSLAGKVRRKIANSGGQSSGEHPSE